MFELKSLTPLLLFLAASRAAPEARPQYPGSNPYQQAGQPQPGYPYQGGQPQQGYPYQAGQPQPAFNPSQPPNAAIPAAQPTGWPYGAGQPQPAFNPYQNPNAGVPAANPTGWPFGFGGQQAPRPTPTNNDEPKWTPPPLWGIQSGRQPFGPKTATTAAPFPGAVTAAPQAPSASRPDYCSNTDVICTTNVEPPREEMPFKVTCGRTLYLEDDINNAITAGCFYVKNNKTIGGSEYPKVFGNQQRFDFGPVGKGAGQALYEMPLIGSAAYAGGPAGQDRIVFSTPNCFLAGEITQQSAGIRGYTECTEQY